MWFPLTRPLTWFNATLVSSVGSSAGWWIRVWATRHMKPCFAVRRKDDKKKKQEEKDKRKLKKNKQKHKRVVYRKLHIHKVGHYAYKRQHYLSETPLISPFKTRKEQKREQEKWTLSGRVATSVRGGGLVFSLHSVWLNPPHPLPDYYH